jgi:hypothetical protein
MTNKISYHNYTFNTKINGIYKADMTCTDATGNGAESFFFRVTPTGDERGIALFLIILLSGVVLLIFASFTGVEYLAFIGGILFVLSGIYSVIYGISNLSNVYTSGLGVVLSALGVFFMVISSLRLIEQVEDEKELF